MSGYLRHFLMQFSCCITLSRDAIELSLQRKPPCWRYIKAEQKAS